MRISEIRRCAFSTCATIALLAGCDGPPFVSDQGRLAHGDTQPPTGAPSAMHQASAVAANAADLLYVVNQDLGDYGLQISGRQIC